MHIEFGLAHPGLFVIIAGDPSPRPLSPAAATGAEVLRRRVRNIALAGRLRVSETLAVGLLESVGLGTILTLLRQPESRRDPGLSEFAREAVVAAISSEPALIAGSNVNTIAATLRASLDSTSVLSVGERHLMQELLERIADRRSRT